MTAVVCECYQHSVERVVAIRGLLAGHSACNGIAHEEDPDLGVLAATEGAGEPNGVERLGGTIGGAVDD